MSDIIHKNVYCSLICYFDILRYSTLQQLRRSYLEMCVKKKNIKIEIGINKLIYQWFNTYITLSTKLISVVIDGSLLKLV